LNKDEWRNAKEAEAIQPAGRLCPSPKPYDQDPDAEPVTVVPEDKWTDGIKNIVAYARFLGKELMGVEVLVRSPGQGGGDEEQLRCLRRARALGIQHAAPRPQVV
jgi:hypothetical protein